MEFGKVGKANMPAVAACYCLRHRSITTWYTVPTRELPICTCI